MGSLSLGILALLRKEESSSYLIIHMALSKDILHHAPVEGGLSHIIAPVLQDQKVQTQKARLEREEKKI